MTEMQQQGSNAALVELLANAGAAPLGNVVEALVAQRKGAHILVSTEIKCLQERLQHLTETFTKQATALRDEILSHEANLVLINREIRTLENLNGGKGR